jgi:hypothetical protein
MAQDITVIRTNTPDGEMVERSDVNLAPIIGELHEKKLAEKFPFLAGIDEYGGTYFNQLQLPYVIRELGILIQEKEMAQHEGALEKLIVFMQKAKELHQFIGCLGD